MESFEPSVLLAPVSLSLSVPSSIPRGFQWERDQSMKGQEEEEKKTYLDIPEDA